MSRRGKKLSEDLIEKIREMRKEGKSIREIANELKLSTRTVRKYVKGVELAPTEGKKKVVPVRKEEPEVKEEVALVKEEVKKPEIEVKEELKVEEKPKIELPKIAKEEEKPVQAKIPEYKEVEEVRIEVKREVEAPEPRQVKALPFESDYIGDKWVVLRWSYPYPDPNFDHYEIYRSTSPSELGKCVVDWIGNQFKNMCFIAHLSPKTTYYFTIRAYNKQGKYTQAKFPSVKTRSKYGMFLYTLWRRFLEKLGGKPREVIVGSTKDLLDFYGHKWIWTQEFSNCLHHVYRFMYWHKMAGGKLTPKGEELFQMLASPFVRTEAIPKKPKAKEEEEKRPLIQKTLK